MAHIKISNNNPGRALSLVIDGVDVSKKVYARNFAVTFPEAFEGRPSVTVEIPADVLEIDLPEAVVVALREADAPRDLESIVDEVTRLNAAAESGYRRGKK